MRCWVGIVVGAGNEVSRTTFDEDRIYMMHI